MLLCITVGVVFLSAGIAAGIYLERRFDAWKTLVDAKDFVIEVAPFVAYLAYLACRDAIRWLLRRWPPKP